MTFRSAVDPWFPLLAIGLPLVVVIFALGPVGPHSLSKAMVAGMVSLFTIGLPVWLLKSTRYVVKGDTLQVRSGPLRLEIPLSEIHSVQASRSLLAAPALSLNRLEICYGPGQSVLVSPADREGFLYAIGHTVSETRSGA